jgi:hypothetical protein
MLIYMILVGSSFISGATMTITLRIKQVDLCARSNNTKDHILKVHKDTQREDN